MESSQEFTQKLTNAVQLCIEEMKPHVKEVFEMKEEAIAKEKERLYAMKQQARGKIVRKDVLKVLFEEKKPAKKE